MKAAFVSEIKKDFGDTGGGHPARTECSEWHIQPHRLPANPPQTGDPKIQPQSVCWGPQVNLVQVRWKKAEHSPQLRG